MNQVKIFDGKGNLKEVISAEAVSAKAWKEFGYDPANFRGKSFEVVTKKCPECGKDFEKLNSNQRYCQRVKGKVPCSVKAYKRKIKVPQIKLFCRKCQKPFIGDKNRVFCNDPCRYTS